MADDYPECVRINQEIDLENPEEGLKKLLVKIKPSWKGQELKIQPITHGLQELNKTLICSTLGDAAERTDAVLVKVLKKNANAALVKKDEAREFHNWKQLNKHKVGVPLLGRFDNGLVQKFSSGSLLTQETINDPHISKLVAEELARFHDASLRDEIYKDQSGGPDDLNWFQTIMRRTLRGLKEYENKGEHTDVLSKFMPVDEMVKEYNMMDEHLESLNMEMVLCHGDHWRENILYDKEKDKLTIIDYECMDKYYSAFDLGVFLVACSDNPPVKDKRPSEEFCKTFIKHYLIKRRELQGKSGKEVTQQEIEQNYLHACLCMPMRCFHIGIITMYFYLQNRTDLGWKIAYGFYQFYKDSKELYWPKQ